MPGTIDESGLSLSSFHYKSTLLVRADRSFVVGYHTH
jgi:hypothetical protein